MNRRLAAVLLAALAVVSLAPVAAASATPTLSDIRTGRHADFDRVVLDLSALPGQYRAMEVTAVRNCGSGLPVPVPGNEILHVVLIPAAAHDEQGNPTYTGPRNFPTPGLTNVRGVALTCDFEATLGVAVGYHNPNAWHQITKLSNPSRVVIDIGH